MVGDRDVCQCNLPGFRNDPNVCYHNVESARIGERSQEGEDLVRLRVFALARCTPGLASEQARGCCDTWPDSHSHNAVDFECAAVWGGTNRLQRALNWVAHLRWLYGGDFIPKVGFFEGGHDDSAMGHSDQFREWVFGGMRPSTKMLETQGGHPSVAPDVQEWMSEVELV